MNAILIAGAALVGLPILLHLIMKQEPKRLTFPAFRFLKQKLKTNQRKLRLRHFILLALRMLIIAFFCLTLYQPTFKSDRLNIHGEQPVAVVIIIDTTPSMGYVSGDKTRLDEARRRALELLDQLPEKSPIAILDTSDLAGNWLPVGDRAAARRRIEELKETRAGQPVTSAIGVAYTLLANVEKETDSGEELPKLVAVFTDRTVASWDPARADDLKKLHEAVPKPKPVHILIDFGVDAPANIGILSAEMKPQVIAANQTANVTVTIGSAGGDRSIDVTVLAKLDGAAKTDSKAVSVPAGQQRTLAFEFRGLKPGLHQVEFRLAADDRLAADNTRFLTFKVGEARRILTITDDPEAAAFWQAAHVAREEFSCLVVRPDQVQLGDDKVAVVKYAPDPTPPDDLRAFEVVTLLNVANPNALNEHRPADGTLWDRLKPYLRSGGKLVVIPGPDTQMGSAGLAGYNATTDLMPGLLRRVIDTGKLNPPPPEQKASSWPAPREGKNGVAWVLDERALKHPMLKIIDDWRQQKSNLDVLANPRTVKKYWEVEPDKAGTPVVFYRDAENPKDRRPAVLERSILDKDGRAKGKVLLLTTRMDVPPADDQWSDYWEKDGSTWFAAFPYLVVRYLAGDTADANFNFATGATVTVPLPRGRLTRDSVVVLDGPGVVGEDAKPKLSDKQTEVRVGPPLTLVPGNFALSSEKDRVVIWRDGFSTNIPAEEFNLEKVPVEAVEDVVGKDRVFPVDRNVPLSEIISGKIGHPIDLFPWLLIAVLMLLVLEGFVANRFYRRAKA
jgi:hypothetical protein